MIDFDELIDKYIKKEHKPKGIGRYYPSEAGQCQRKVWYSYKYPSEIDPSLRKIFEMGNIIHDFVVQVLKSEKTPQVELLKSEFPFKEQIEDFMISGRIDNLIKVKLNNKIFLVEVKSTGSIKFIKEPPPHNTQQLQLYMHFIGIHNGLLVYIDKTNLKTKVFNIEYNKNDALKIIERFKILHSLLKNNILPKPEAKINGTEWMCRYCEYENRCQNNLS